MQTVFIWVGGLLGGSPSQRVRRSKKFILARTREKNHSPTHERTILAWNFHSRDWKLHSRLKISIPGLVFLRPERDSEWKNHSRLKISFRVKSLMFSILPLEIEFVQSWGPLGSLDFLFSELICQKEILRATLGTALTTCKLRDDPILRAMLGTTPRIGGKPKFQPRFSELFNEQTFSPKFIWPKFWKSLQVVDIRAFGSWMSAPPGFEGPDSSFAPAYLRERSPDVRGISAPITFSLGRFSVLAFPIFYCGGPPRSIIRVLEGYFWTT